MELLGDLATCIEVALRDFDEENDLCNQISKLAETPRVKTTLQHHGVGTLPHRCQ